MKQYYIEIEHITLEEDNIEELCVMAGFVDNILVFCKKGTLRIHINGNSVFKVIETAFSYMSEMFKIIGREYRYQLIIDVSAGE